MARKVQRFWRDRGRNRVTPWAQRCSGGSRGLPWAGVGGQGYSLMRLVDLGTWKKSGR